MTEDKRYTLVVRFDITGQLGYLSHQETSRMFERVFLRSYVPVRYSEGFNPRVRMSLPFPRTVGVQSIGDLVVVAIDGADADSEQLRASMQKQMPEGCCISSVEILDGKASYQPEWVEYEILAEGVGADADVCQKVSLLNDELSSGGSFFVDRYWPKKRKYKKVDICQYLESLELKDDGLVAGVKVTQAGSVRVDELLEVSGVGREKITGPITRSNVRFVRSR
jgi:radical SAM-linked protein